MSRKKKNVVSEPTLAFNEHQIKDIELDRNKSSVTKEYDKANINPEAFSRSRFLTNSIGLYAFLLKLMDNNGKILPFIYLSLITGAELKIHGEKLEKFYVKYNEKARDYFESYIEDYKDWGFIFFIYLIGENPQKYGVNQNPKKEFRYIQQAVKLIADIRKGKKSAKAMLEFIEYFNGEHNNIGGLKEFMVNINKDDPFLNLSEINRNLNRLINIEKLNSQYLKNWERIINILGTVLENSAKDPKDFIMDFLSSKSNKIDELNVLLFGLFFIRLFYGYPYDKVIPLSLLDNNAMDFIAPLTESFISPNFIIEGSKKTKINLDEYFWIYVRNKPRSIFEDVKIEEIEIVKKIKRKRFGEIILFDIE